MDSTTEPPDPTYFLKYRRRLQVLVSLALLGAGAGLILRGNSDRKVLQELRGNKSYSPRVSVDIAAYDSQDRLISDLQLKRPYVCVIALDQSGVFGGISSLNDLLSRLDKRVGLLRILSSIQPEAERLARFPLATRVSYSLGLVMADQMRKREIPVFSTSGVWTIVGSIKSPLSVENIANVISR